MTKKIIGIVPAAGTGERARGGAQPAPKQYRLIRGEPMLRLAVRSLLADGRIDQVRVGVAPGDDRVVAALAGLPRTVWSPCGGPRRADTVVAALSEAALKDDDWVLVHDAARPGLPADALARLIDACLASGTGGLLALPVADTVKRGLRIDETSQRAGRTSAATNTRQGLHAAGSAVQAASGDQTRDQFVVHATISRDGLWLAQTPQMFPAGPLLRALLAARADGAVITDEASAMERAGYSSMLVAGSARNFKVTWPDDFELMGKWL
ncbi:MAG: 2-C-methyl-D-erythritol 4-phosphate cytidylyltransferase [Burkholderiaceae bacterium]|nr:MAG: 2-C-methyl-D-erythritol 4-phosphate cytidylyltransferase [Burkholderiaceae bacterium]